MSFAENLKNQQTKRVTHDENPLSKPVHFDDIALIKLLPILSRSRLFAVFYYLYRSSFEGFGH